MARHTTAPITVDLAEDLLDPPPLSFHDLQEDAVLVQQDAGDAVSCITNPAAFRETGEGSRAFQTRNAGIGQPQHGGGSQAALTPSI
jgi:hypothetical protein